MGGSREEMLVVLLHGPSTGAWRTRELTGIIHISTVWFLES